MSEKQTQTDQMGEFQQPQDGAWRFVSKIKTESKKIK